ncbi:hypothetical protein DSM109990_03859 (plasmid) [Sulfitobacter dubius]|uniref:Uncharacterized protein n=1 Tax=Sulfitobacter dubius TaxID=218673 RepID=A0ABY3ZQR4_9RHOB|nr:hypothetical protein DSM109990_03859 [Sulfitobacter dubius]
MADDPADARVENGLDIIYKSTGPHNGEYANSGVWIFFLEKFRAGGSRCTFGQNIIDQSDLARRQKIRPHAKALLVRMNQRSLPHSCKGGFSNR